MDKLADQQEVMAAIADMVIECYAMDSALARALKLDREGLTLVAMMFIYFSGAMSRIEAAARKVLACIAEGDTLRTQMAILRRLAKHEPVNVIALQEQIAAGTIEAGKYAL